MKLNVQLYGTLGRSVDAYDHQSGLEIQVGSEMNPAVNTIEDLLGFLKLSPQGIGMIFMNGVPVPPATLLEDGARIRIFQPIFGG